MSDSSSVLYLHGFASSPRSRKAQFFAEKLKAAGISMQIPDLEAGDFERLTVSRQLELLDSLINDKPRILIGSSLGGYLASLYSARHATVKRVVLLAPAFGFCQLWMAQLGPNLLTEWQRTGYLKVFHHGQGREMPLSYEFIEDAARPRAISRRASARLAVSRKPGSGGTGRAIAGVCAKPSSSKPATF